MTFDSRGKMGRLLTFALVLSGAAVAQEDPDLREEGAREERRRRPAPVAEVDAGSPEWVEPSGPVEEAVVLDAGVIDVAAADDVSSRVASYATTKLRDSPAVVTVITSDEIRDSGARDLIDVLWLVPGFNFGVDVQNVVGPSFRGLWAHEGKILLLVDGKEMNELLYSTMQLGNEIPIDLVERVEVVRGPGSVIYGGNGELAVINVITRGLQGATDLMVSGGYGQYTSGTNFATSYARRYGTASGRWVVDEVPGLSGFASFSIGQGQRSVRPYTDYAGTTSTMEGQSALDPMLVQGGIGYRNFQATVLYHRLNNTSIDGSDLATPLIVTTFESLNAEAMATFRPTERFEIIPRFNYTWQRPWTTSDMGSDYYYDKTVQRLRGRLIGRWAPIDELQLTVGGDAMFDFGQLNGPANVGLQTLYGNSDTVQYQTIAAFAELYSENPILNVAAGARFDFNSAVGPSVVPRLVLLRSFGPVNLKGLFSLAFRWPGIENLNLALETMQPERTTVFEFEGSVDITKGQRLSANVFDVGISAPIAYFFDSENNSEGYKNLGRQGSRGVEAAYKVRGGWGRAALSYSLYVPAYRDNVDTYSMPGLPGVYPGAPVHRGTASATFRPWDWLGISPTVIVMSPRYAYGPVDDEGFTSVTEVPTQVLANLSVRVDDLPIKGLGISLTVYNLFGTDFSYLQPYDGGHAPLPGLDREVMLRLSYLFEPSFD